MIILLQRQLTLTLKISSPTGKHNLRNI